MKITILLNLVVLLLTTALAPAATRLVPDEYPAIQDAIDACVDGDVVIVAPGTYTGPGNRDIDFGGKAITVQSTDPQDPAVVAATVIDCQGAETNPHRGFYFHNSEGPDSVLAGLTITNGYGPDEPVYAYPLSAGGAIFCTGSSPTITRCSIKGNYSSYIGGGIYCRKSSPIVANCTFSGNSAHHGAGICNKDGNPVVVNCTFSGNSVPETGGAMLNYFNANAIIANCTLSGNTARIGGGIYTWQNSSPSVTNCIFSGNSANQGGGMRCEDNSSPIIRNCAFIGNWAREWGGAVQIGRNSSPKISNCTFSDNFAQKNGQVMANFNGGCPTLNNCILWRNITNLVSQIFLRKHSSVSISYCNIQGGEAAIYAIEESWYHWGDGNMNINPLLESDGYHLKPDSPCIDAGDPLGNYGGQIDIDKQSRVIGFRTDIGADEYGLEVPLLISIIPTQIEFTAFSGDPNLHSKDLIICNIGTEPVNWTIVEDCHWLTISEMSGTLTNGVAQITLSADASNLSQGHYDCGLIISDGYPSHRPLEATVTLVVHLEGQLHVPQDFKTIQSAIDAAHDGDTVLVADGTYTGNGNRNIDFGGKRITVQSENGPGNCIIDCEGIARGFYFHSNEDANSVLAGFTVTNGYVYNRGGAIYCRDSSPTLNNCRFIGNSTGGHGGAVKNSDSSPLLIHCVFNQNRAVNFGGAMENYESNPILIECTFSGNSAKSSGAMYNYESNPTLTNCIFNDNIATAYDGGGIYNHNSCPTFTNCIFSGNWAGRDGGGMKNWCRSKPMLVNCTFSGNTAGMHGGGMCNTFGSNTAFINCILWGNSARNGSEIALCAERGASTASISYSDMQGGQLAVYIEQGCTLTWGEGNIDADPCFADPVGGDYHLLAESPCIDTGNPDYIPSLGETDIDGEPRVMGGRVDMGADEFTSTLTPILRISPIEFQFSSYEDGPNPEEQILSIHNIGSGTLNWEIAEDCLWLEVYPPNGESTGQVNEVTLSVDISGLAPGSYNCQLTIVAEGAVNSPQVVLVTLNLGGSELYVPSEYDTIQAAIDAAIHWDTVIVADGIYTCDGNRDIDFIGKAITVRSENGPANCIIDCNGTEDQPHRGFYFHNEEDANSILGGLTITNGYAKYGAGIYCEGSQPTIANCIITGNTAQYDGGGIFLGWQSGPVPPPPPPPLPPPLGTVQEQSSPEVLSGTDIPGPTITNCTFSGNSAVNGGGMYISRDSSTLIDCIFTENSANKGGGMYNSSSSPRMSKCKFNNNSAKYGGGIFNYHSDLMLLSCVFSGNYSYEYGGGIHNTFSDLTVVNCTLTGNSSGLEGGGIYMYVLPPQPPLVPDGSNAAVPLYYMCVITNCILWENLPEQIVNYGLDMSVTYSDVQGGWAGEGNINADPLFVAPGYWDANAVWIEGDYHLLQDSPCINAGDPNYIAEPNETDLDGKPRVIGGRIDMGAYEFNHIPIADAGADREVYAWIDGIAEVTLDGTNSYDEDGHPLTYLWNWIIDGNSFTATEPNVTIELPVGKHIIELIVNDGIDDSEPNEVVITVIEPIQSQLWIVPRVINRRSHRPRILALLRLPEGVTKDQVDSDQPLLLYPGGIEAIRQYVIGPRRGRAQQVSILAVFDKAELMDAIPDNGRVELEVVGRLKTGRYFYGTDTVRIIRRQRRQTGGSGDNRRVTVPLSG